MLGTVLDWLRARVDAVGVASPSRRRLAPLTEVWDKIRGSARDAESLNLDKRAALFVDLRGSRAGDAVALTPLPDVL